MTEMLSGSRGTILVACPMNAHTGGVELLYQLVNELKLQGFSDSHLFFQGTRPLYHPYPDYQKYLIDPVFIGEVATSYSGILVLPEVMTGLIHRYREAQKMIWWESVDNYCGGGFGGLCPSIFLSFRVYGPLRAARRMVFKTLSSFSRNSSFAHFREIKQSVVLNLVQSQYAYSFLKSKKIPSSKIAPLFDYLSDSFFDNEISFDDVEKKENIVLFNPRKGYPFTKKIIKKNPNIKFIALEGLSSSEISDLFQRAKVYIDFGNHPGKDRMPREAASRLCCIIVGKNGSAKNDTDVPIPNKYKFQTTLGSIRDISDLIQYIFSNFASCIADFAFYRKEIASEKDEFSSQVHSVFTSYFSASTHDDE